jgi:F-type H+-transporting ATPase subunit b
VLIDWFTVGAQALNFLILVWLLKRYLYRPVLAAIDAREKTVAKKIADAAARDSQAQEAGETLRKRNEAFDQEREGLMRKATDEGSAERQRLMESARQDTTLLRSKLTLALDAERAELGRQLSLGTQAEVFAVARKALSDLAGVSLEERMMEVFIGRLAGAGVSASPAGATGVAAPARLALVRSAFEPAPAAQARLEAAIRGRLSPGTTVRFETSPELICGIELTVDGEKLAWSVADYLAILARDVAVLTTTELAAAPTEAARVH